MSLPHTCCPTGGAPRAESLLSNLGTTTRALRALSAPCEGHDVVAPGTYACEWEIVSVSEKREVGPAALQGLVGHVELDPTIPPLGKQLLDQRYQALCGALVQPCEESLACGKVDRAPVVRVDQAIIPQFGPLVKMRDARGGALEEGLSQ